MSHDQPFKEINGYGRECSESVVIWAGCLCVLGHRDYGGLLETCWYYRLNQGHVEDVSEDRVRESFVRVSVCGVQVI